MALRTRLTELLGIEHPHHPRRHGLDRDGRARRSRQQRGRPRHHRRGPHAHRPAARADPQRQGAHRQALRRQPHAADAAHRRARRSSCSTSASRRHHRRGQPRQVHGRAQGRRASRSCRSRRPSRSRSAWSPSAPTRSSARAWRPAATSASSRRWCSPRSSSTRSTIPVVAAGGIADGRGVAAAFALGAEGVQVGTRFMCAEECTIHPDVKEQVIKAKDRDTVVTGRSTGHPVRVLKNKLSRADRGARPREQARGDRGARQRQARAGHARGRRRDGLAHGRAGGRDGVRDPAGRRDRRRDDAPRPRPSCARLGTLPTERSAMTARTALVFPGQGSQRAGMLDARARDRGPRPPARRRRGALGPRPARDRRRRTRRPSSPTPASRSRCSTSPTGRGASRCSRAGVEPVAVAGHSLGELAALAIAGVFSVEAGLELVVERSGSWPTVAAATPGGMAAVLGMDGAQIAAAIARHRRRLARQRQRAGPGRHLRARTTGVERGDRGARRGRRPHASCRSRSRAPFHSPLMEPARAAFADILAQRRLRATRAIPVVPEHRSRRPRRTRERIRERLVAQITSPVRWTETMQALVADGIDHARRGGPGRGADGARAQACRGPRRRSPSRTPASRRSSRRCS